jgi:ubiquinol-cytochrome c reductase cytochrome c subunit
VRLHLTPTKALIGLAIVAAANVSLFTGAGATPPPQSPYMTTTFNAGTPNSSIVQRNATGQVTSYGDSAITYTLPPAAYIADGEALYDENCASCHGNTANGVPDSGVPGTFPNLQLVGPAAVDFWIDTGRMPATAPRNVQAVSKFVRLNEHQALEIAAWIDSLTKTPPLPWLPTVNMSGGSVSAGAALFALNCAACHTITGGGDSLADDTFSSPLRHVAGFEIAEAIRTGPGNMPTFSGNLNDAQVRDIVLYVTNYIEHPENPGGFGLGGLGPVAEGFVGLALGVGILCLIAFWVGERA